MSILNSSAAIFFLNALLLIFSNSCVAQSSSIQDKPAVDWVERVRSVGTAEGWKQLQAAITKTSLESIGIGSDLFDSLESELNAEEALEFSANLIAVLTIESKIQALLLLKPLIKKSVPVTQVLMGLIYLNGRGVLKPDCDEAFKWFEKSLSNGNKVGFYEVGRAYYSGCGVRQDFVKAHLYFNLARMRGHSLATAQLEQLNGQLSQPEMTDVLDLANRCVAKKFVQCIDKL